MKRLRKIAMALAFAITLQTLALTVYAEPVTQKATESESQSTQTPSPTITPLDTRAKEIEVKTLSNAQVEITVTTPEKSSMTTSGEANTEGIFKLASDKWTLAVTENGKLIKDSQVTARAKVDGKEWSPSVSIFVAEEPAVNAKAFTLKVIYEDESPVQGIKTSAFKILNDQEKDVSKNFAIRDLGAGLYEFVAKTAPEGYTVRQLPVRDKFTIHVNLVDDPFFNDYGQKQAGVITVLNGQPMEAHKLILKLISPDFQIRVLNENFEPVYDRLVQLVKLQVDKDGKAQLISGYYKPVGYAFWSAVTKQGEKIGVNSDFLHPVEGTDQTGLYYFGKTDSYVKAGDQFGIRVYSSDSDEVSAQLPLTYRLIEPWDRSGKSIQPALKGTVEVVSNPKTNVTINFTFVEDSPSKKPISDLKVQLQKDQSAALAKEDYVKHDQSQTTGKNGKVTWRGLTLDRGTVKEGPTARKNVVVLPLRLILEDLPKGLDPLTKTIQVEISQEALQGRTSFDLEIPLATNTLVRSAGSNRYETAVLSAKLAYPEGVQADDGYYDFVLASGESFPDALAAAPLAGIYDGPVLLTAKSNLPDNVKSYIQALMDKRPTAHDKIRITLIGGEGTISKSVYTSLKDMGLKVDRIYGSNRIATSIAIGKEVMKNLPAGSDKKVVLASQANFADALAISPLAAEKHYPIILTAKEALDPAAKEVLVEWNPSKVYIVGGTGSISKGLAESIGLGGLQIDTDRISGTNRYKTATAIAETFYADTRSVFVASGTSFPDALSGAIAAMKADSPILLVGSDSNHEEALDFIKDHKIPHITILGGEKSVTKTTEKAFKKAINLD